MKLSKLLLLVSSFFLGQNFAYSQVVNLPNNPYVAFYEIKNNYGVSQKAVLYDGKGHCRVETKSANGLSSIGITDLNKKVVYMLSPGLGEAITIPLDSKTLETLEGLGQSVKHNEISLGKRLICGHLCSGFHYNLESYSVDYWTADDLNGLRVESKCTHPQLGCTVTTLKSFNRNMPEASLFKLSLN